MGVTIVSYTVTDEAGNTATCSFTLTIQDTQPPTISCPTDITLNNTPGNCHNTATWTPPFGPALQDNCGILSLTSTYSPGDTFPVGQTVVIYTATDVHGNTATCSFFVTVHDNEEPVFTACPTMPINLGPNPEALPDEAMAIAEAGTVTDNCSMVEVSAEGGMVEEDGCKRTQTWTVTAADTSGNTAVCEVTFKWTVGEEVLEFAACPEAPIELGWNITVLPNEEMAIEAAGEVSGEEVEFSAEGGDVVPEGCVRLQVWTVTATDACGNTAMCEVVFTWTEDEVAPEFEACPEEAISLGCNPEALPDAVMAIAAAGVATDNCSEEVDVSAEGGEIAEEGCVRLQVWTVTATDACGNTAMCEVVFTWTEDNTPPTITAEMIGPCYSDAMAAELAAKAATTATDECGPVSLTTSISGTCNVTITVTATDGCGNSTSTTYTTVIDGILPSLACPDAQNLILDASCTATLPDYRALAIASDNCASTLSIAQMPAAGSPVSNAGPMTITLSTDDDCGNTVNCTFTVNKVDNNPPSIICPNPQTLLLGAGCTAVLPDYASLATATDNCTGSVTITQSPTAGTVVSGVGAMTASLAASDGSGNSAVCTFTVNKVDNTPPALTCPAAQTLPLGAGCTAVLPDYASLATATDNCTGSVAITQSPTAGTVVSGVGAMTVALTASDDSGNSAVCTFTVNKVDNTPPALSCPQTQEVFLNDTCKALLGNYVSLATATDNCTGSATITQSPAAGTVVSGVGAVTVTLIADDGNGNTATCSFAVNKVDTIVPSITCPATQTVVLNEECEGILGDYSDLASAADNCGIGDSGVSQVPAPGTHVEGTGLMTITLTISDVGGNTASCTFSVNKVDGSTPTIVPPANITVECTNVPAAAPLVVQGICGHISVPLTSQTFVPGSCGGSGVITRTWTFTDAYGNTTAVSQTITVTDNQPPTFTPVPPNITVQCNNIPPAEMPTATDCGPVVITYVGQTSTSGTCANQYTLRRRWVAADQCGNTRMVTQQITVVDYNKPFFTSFPNDTTVICAMDVPPPALPTASDSCGSATVQLASQTVIAGSCANKFQVRRVWRATDACGNSIVRTQIIQVSDNQPPVFTFVPPHVTIFCGDLPPSVGEPTATDGCGNTVSIAYLGETASGSCPNAHTRTRTWRATDVCGNSTTAVQIITVQGTPLAPGAAERTGPLVQWDEDRILTLQPNPTTDRVLIGVGSFAGERILVSIHNEIGQIIWERAVDAVPDLMLPVSLREVGAAPGLYTVSIRSSGRTVAKRLALIE